MLPDINALVKFTTVKVNVSISIERTITKGRTRVLPAVNALVKFTTVNVNAVHINRKDYNNRKDQGVARHKRSG